MRTIIESPEFTAACATLGVQRMDEILAGIQWALSNDPWHALFPEVPGTGIRFAAIEPTPVTPEMRIYFRVVDGDEYVELLVIETVDGADPDDPVV